MICSGELASNGHKLKKCEKCRYKNDRDAIVVNMLRVMKSVALKAIYESHRGEREGDENL
ncbi:MAG: hypothetical protein QXS21_04675 [Thermoproteota archaeon]|nr:hypothetical protein [Candidatus Brockarchaeota archaeon]MBO3767822.1 hypothetical protein [Candidatus Brockarchaeota archaeon]MBO3801132.1 hypothetical protein [Candidatus Brockarchaeota archaeon]